MQQTPLDLSSRRVNFILFALLSLYPLVGMGVDLIAPSLPAISQNLSISTTFSKNLIAIYLFGYACGNFIIGFLSDALGRRKLIVLGLFIFVIVSLLPTFFINATVLLLARFLQGFAIAAFAVVARAIFSDILPPERLIRMAILISTTWGIGPIIGPVIGGYLQFYFNWQACFYFFAAFGALGFIVIFLVLPETHFHRQPLNIKQLGNNFATIVSHRLFMGMVILMGITYSLLIVFNTLGPFLIQSQLGRTPIYFGHVALFLGLTFLIGTIVCRRLTKYHKPEKILQVAVLFFLIIATLGLLLAFIANKNMTLIVILSLFMFLGCGIIYPAGMSKGISLFRHLAGSGSAIMNLINVLITSITAFLMGFVTANNAIPMAVFYLVLMLLCGIIWWLLIRGNESG
jgi:Bcr/CflA subfamily drug resistance transporter